MIPIDQAFLEQCPTEKGFRLRGINMTRIDVFVDAAFAFAITMLVISFDSIPQNFSEMVIAIKNIPAFIASVVQLVWIWHTHNIWSKRFGLDNGMTVILSTSLLIVVLIYIYPLRIMNQGMMNLFTNSYLPNDFNLESIEELSMMFIFLGVGFFAFCVLFVCFNRYAISLKNQLRLNELEIYETKTLEIIWIGASAIALLCIVLASVLSDDLVKLSGFSLFLFAFWAPYITISRRRKRPVELVSSIS